MKNKCTLILAVVVLPLAALFGLFWFAGGSRAAVNKPNLPGFKNLERVSFFVPAPDSPTVCMLVLDSVYKSG